MLTGWKAIATFLGVSVRAAQLWEKEGEVHAPGTEGAIQRHAAAAPGQNVQYDP
jgi:hypothetical protein